MRTRWTMWAVPVALVFAGTALAQDPLRAEAEVVEAVEPAPVADAIAVADAIDVEVANEGEELCGDLFSEAETVVNALTAATPGSCKPCKGRTWCKCTYNGNPRASCDPCCYQTYAGTLICFD